MTLKIENNIRNSNISMLNSHLCFKKNVVKNKTKDWKQDLQFKINVAITLRF